MDLLKKEELYTIKDIYALPDGKRADYIDAQKGDCEVNIAPFAVFLSEDGRNWPQVKSGFAG